MPSPGCTARTANSTTPKRQKGRLSRAQRRRVAGRRQSSGRRLRGGRAARLGAAFRSFDGRAFLCEAKGRPRLCSSSRNDENRFRPPHAGWLGAHRRLLRRLCRQRSRAPRCASSSRMDVRQMRVEHSAALAGWPAARFRAEGPSEAADVRHPADGAAGQPLSSPISTRCAMPRGCATREGRGGDDQRHQGSAARRTGMRR